jgi:hypothetical protein
MKLPGFISEVTALHKSRRTYVSHNAGSLERSIASRIGAIRLTDCFGIWTDTNSDRANCGGCGIACDATETCCIGERVPLKDNCGGCGVPCVGQGYICCVNDAGDYECVDSRANSSHCGACDRQCEVIASPLHTLTKSCCVNSQCLTTQNLATDPHHCGDCDTDCVRDHGSGWKCSEGHCCRNCEVWFDGASDRDWGLLGGIGGTILGGLTGGLAGWLLGKYLDRSIGPGCYSCETINEHTSFNLACCDGINCTNLDTDLVNCGRCGNRCTDQAYNMICVKGRGGYGICACPPGLPDKCRGECVNLTTGTGADGLPFRCGTCENICPSGTVCCDGICTDLINNRLHCGKCGKQCPTACCGSDCKDILSDHDNCGECKHPCDDDKVCIAGQCVKEIPVT